MEGIHVYSNERPPLSPSGDYSENVNYIENKSFLLQNTGPISTKHGSKHPWMEGIHVYSNERLPLSPRGHNSENVKLYLKYLKIFFSRTTRPISTKLRHKASFSKRE